MASANINNSNDELNERINSLRAILKNLNIEGLDIENALKEEKVNQIFEYFLYNLNRNNSDWDSINEAVYKTHYIELYQNLSEELSGKKRVISKKSIPFIYSNEMIEKQNNPLEQEMKFIIEDYKNLYTKTQEQNSKFQQEFASLHHQILLLKTELSEQKSSLNNIENNILMFKELIYGDSFFGNSVQSPKNIPVNIYLDTNDKIIIRSVFKYVNEYLSISGFNTLIEFPDEKGSWFKRMVARSVGAITHDEVLERLKEGEYAIEVNGIIKTQSEVDKNQSEALSNIILSLKDVPNGVIHIGSLLVVKITTPEGIPNIQSRTLSIKELHLLNKNPGLLKRPQDIMDALYNEIKPEKPQQNNNQLLDGNTPPNSN